MRVVEDGIYSVFSESSVPYHYDKRAALYDLVVGSHCYNRIMWGGSPGDYVTFVREAVASNSGTEMLEAGCGSMLFTARQHLESGRRVIAFDQSLGMLRRARSRLIRLAGGLPERIILVQADVNDTTFEQGAFGTVLCLNVLHILDDAENTIRGLNRSLSGDGNLFVTSLVTNGRLVGDRYLAALHRAGEVARPRSSTELHELLDSCLDARVSFRTKGNMAYANSLRPS